MAIREGLVRQIKKEETEETKQKQLRDKHHVTETGVVVVEKNNMVKFLVKTVGIIIRTAAAICLIILAAIGLMTLLYPDMRRTFFDICDQIRYQIINYI